MASRSIKPHRHAAALTTGDKPRPSIDSAPRHVGLRAQIQVRCEHPVPGAPDPARVSVLDRLGVVGHQVLRGAPRAPTVPRHRRR